MNCVFTPLNKAKEKNVQVKPAIEKVSAGVREIRERIVLHEHILPDEKDILLKDERPVGKGQLSIPKEEYKDY